jgi:hypothetical protein
MAEVGATSRPSAPQVPLKKALVSLTALRSPVTRNGYSDACFLSSATSFAVSRDALAPKRAVT